MSQKEKRLQAQLDNARKELATLRKNYQHIAVISSLDMHLEALEDARFACRSAFFAKSVGKKISVLIENAQKRKEAYETICRINSEDCGSPAPGLRGESGAEHQHTGGEREDDASAQPAPQEAGGGGILRAVPAGGDA